LQTAEQPRTVSLGDPETGQGTDKLVLDLDGRIGLERPCVRADGVSDRTKRATAVGERSSLPPVGEILELVELTEQLPDESALPDPGDADESHELK